MLSLISPAKTLDFDTPPQTDKASLPDHLQDSKQLISILRKKSPAELARLMGISPKLAELNAERYTQWQLPFNCNNARQSILAFKGDVYIGLDVEGYNQRDFNFAQKNLRILSGLYGLLRPLDLIQPYRLEMGTKLENRRGKDLYEFWGNRISEAIAADLEGHRNKTVVNLASNEYFRAVDSDLLPGRVVTPVFKDFNKGTYKVLSFFAKKARGYMASWIVKNRVNKPDDIKSFDVDGYCFNENFSSETEWVFTRKA